MNNKIKLSTGKEIYANKLLISIGKDYDGKWQIYEGYDGYIDLEEWNPESDNLMPIFSKEELLGLIEFVKNTWTLFALDVINGTVSTKEDK